MEYLELDESNPVLHRMNFLNGRVDATNKSTLNIDRARVKASEHQINVISRNLDCTEVSKVFFSIDNIDLLQRGIRNKILNDTDGQINISRQSDDELKIIMRSMYFQYGKNSKYNIKEQILELNTRVLEWSVPEIISNVKQSQKYLQDISTMPVPLERSTLPSKKGTKTLDVTKYL
jgi:hypothetical protein